MMSRKWRDDRQGRVKKRTVFNSILFFINFLFAAALAFSYLARSVSPEYFWFIAFLGLAYPPLLFSNLFFIFYWGVTIKKRFFLSFIVVLAGLPQLQSSISFHPQELFGNDSTARGGIKIMSYNVHLFDRYGWSKDRESGKKILELIADESPDLLCLQEFYVSDSASPNTLDTIGRSLGAGYRHTEYTSSAASRHRWGIATFSKYPIVNKGRILLNDRNNTCIFTDIKINQDTLRIYNLHLQSIRFARSDYQFMEELKENREGEKIEKSKSILRRLKQAFIRRAPQADKVSRHIRNSPYPVIVCGDFNDTPASYVYYSIAENLQDAFSASGNGTGSTYKGVFPSFRIDYILHSPGFKSRGFRTIKEEYSDHYPVVCYLVRSW